MGNNAGERLSRHGLQSERLLWPTKGPGVFEHEVAALERTLGLTTVEKALAWVRTSSMWPANFGLSCCTIEMMAVVSSRYDIARFGMEYFRPTPRQSDLMIVPGRLSHKMAAPLLTDLRPDAGAEVGGRDGRLRKLGRDVRELRRRAGGRQDCPGRRLRSWLPASSRGADRGDSPSAREDSGGDPSGLRDARRRGITGSAPAWISRTHETSLDIRTVLRLHARSAHGRAERPRRGPQT